LKFDLPFARRASEGKTECRAVKRVRQTMLELGASPALAGLRLAWLPRPHFRRVLALTRYRSSA
jgi:hypothetical protein